MSRVTTRMVIAAVACLALGWYIGQGDTLNPLVPHGNRRPILSFLAKIAKTGLWVMLVAEEPPRQEPFHYAVRRVDDPHSVRHTEGW